MHGMLNWKEFDVRFQDFKLCEVIFAMFNAPVDFDVEKAHEHLQMEHIRTF
jgi:hypothetical protein